MKIYLAARYSRRDEMRKIAATLVEYGHQITSCWITTTWGEPERKAMWGGSTDANLPAPPEHREEYAVKDLDDVMDADCVINFTEAPGAGGRGGRHVEMGVALATRKRTIVIGFRENIFHHYQRVEFYPGLEACLNKLKEEAKCQS